MTTYADIRKPSPSTSRKGETIFNAGTTSVVFARDCKVLYVEDNPFNQEFARRLFIKIGCAVELAANGYEALDMIFKERFDMILMDINMPVLNGYETTSIIRQKLRLKVPILALTTCDSDDDINMSKSVGMNDYLIKPLTEKQLLHSLIKWRKDICVPTR